MALLSPRHINAHRIYVWLAIDPQGVDLARELIKDAGSVPVNDKWHGGEFYSDYFKEKILLCDLSKIQLDLVSTPQNTIRELKAALAPWKEKFYEAYCASS